MKRFYGEFVFAAYPQSFWKGKIFRQIIQSEGTFEWMINDIYFMRNLPRTYNSKISNKDMKDILKSESDKYLGKDGGLRLFCWPKYIVGDLRGAYIRKRELMR